MEETKQVETPISKFLLAPVEIDGKRYLNGVGDTDAKIVLVASHPNYFEARAHGLLSESGALEELDAAFSRVNQPLDGMWYTTMVKYGLGKKSKPSSEDIKACYDFLEEELNTIKPKIIVALGSEVFKRITRTTMNMSDFMGEIIDSPYGKVIACHTPGTIFAVKPTSRPEFQDIMAKAVAYANDTLQYDEFKNIVIDNVDDANRVVDHALSQEVVWLGYDAEWYGDKLCNQVVYTIQFSYQKDKAVTFEISKDGGTENQELWKVFERLVTSPKVRRLGWNIRADDKVLAHRGIHVPEDTLAMDGMKAMQFFDSRWGKGLEWGIKKFTKYKDYYTEFNLALKKHRLAKSELAKLKFFEPEIFFNYCAGDAVAHREACLNIIKFFPNEHKKYFYETFLPLTTYFLELEGNGIPIDIELMEDITNKYNAKCIELKAKLQSLVDTLGEEWKDFNPNSAIKKKELLYGVLKLDPPYYTKAGKSAKPRSWYKYRLEKKGPQAVEDFKPASNGKSLSTLRYELTDQMKKIKEGKAIDVNGVTAFSFEVVKTLLDLNRVNVFANKFFSKQGVDLIGLGLADPEDLVEESDDDEGDPLKQSYWAALSPDKRIYANFFECLKTFRSSSTPNVQNPASKVLSHMPEIFVPGFKDLSKEQKKLMEETVIPRNIRHIFYSGHPDWYVAELDLAGADIYVAALLSADRSFLKDFREGDFHLKKMRTYFKDNTLTKKDGNKYIAGKAMSFRVLYSSEIDAATRDLQAEIYAESGLLIDQKDIRDGLNTWNNYTDYINYREQCKRMVDEKGYIENALGMRLTFERTDDMAIKAGFLQEALAFPVASVMVLFMWDVAIKLRAHFKKAGEWQKYIKPINTIHDSHVFLVHKDMLKDDYLAETFKDYFCDKVRMATGDAFGMELVVGKHWKDENPVFTGETKWNFATGKWDWK